MDRGAWWATVHSITNKVTKGQTRLKQLSMHAHMFILYQFYISDRNNKKSKQWQSKLFKRNIHQATLTQSKYYFNFFQINVNSLDMELLVEELGFHLLMVLEVKVSCSVMSDSVIPIQSMEFSRLEYWDGQPIPSPKDLPNPGIKPGSPVLQVDSLPTELFLIFH